MACCQKATEEVPGYEERFRTTWKEYAGIPNVPDDRDFEGCDYGLVKSAFVARLKPEPANMLKVIKPDWDQRGTNYYELFDRAHQLNRDMGTKLRVLQTGQMGQTPITPERPKTNREVVSQVNVAQSTWWTADLEAPKLQIVCASPVNPATLLPVHAEGEDDHDCSGILQELEDNNQTMNEALQNPDLILYTDGSSFVEN
eukprot:g38464.t1